ncbi:MAG: TA system VapC family ribonuclease toxin [Candidatus Nanopelagicales bacterium]|jgi:toxin-antitoxin system PIN domain toxin
MTYLLDVNVLVALAWPVHVHHAAAHEWFRTHHRSGWATCPTTESGFIRVSSSRRATPDARPPGEAALVLRRMCEVEGHRFLPDQVRFTDHVTAISSHVLGSGQVTDTHLVLLARSVDASLVTFDRGAAQLGTAFDTNVTLLST